MSNIDGQFKKEAEALYRKMFEEVANDPDERSRIERPSNWVKRTQFHIACRKNCIPVPEGYIEACEWEESIGLGDFATRIVRAYHKAHRSDFTPMEKAAMARTRKMRSNLRG